MNRRVARTLVCFTLLLVLTAGATGAGAARAILLPDGVYAFAIPDALEWVPPDRSEQPLRGIWLSEELGLELEIFLYPAGGRTLEETATALTEAGRSAEIRDIGGLPVLCYRDLDEADGAPCIGYVYLLADQFTELTFWYGTEQAGEMTRAIMETLRPAEEAAE